MGARRGLATLGALGWGAGCFGPMTGPAPEVIGFWANPTAVAPGQPTRLEWIVADADTVRIRTRPVRATEDDVPTEPWLESREPRDVVASPPVGAPSVFVLEAENAYGQTEAETTVQVDILGAPQILDFSAAPSLFSRGATVTLAWQTIQGDRALLRAEPGGLIADELPLPDGRFDVQPDAPIQYLLTLIGPDGRVAESSLSLAPTGPRIDDFGLSPAVIDYGDRATAYWTTQDAARLELWVDDAPLITAGVGPEGQIDLGPQTEDRTLRLYAWDDDGRSAVATAALRVLPPTGPVILALSASPNPGAAGRTATVSWAQLGAVRTRLLQADDILFESFDPDETSAELVLPLGAADLVLELSDGADTATATLRVEGDADIVIDQFEVSPKALPGAGNLAITWLFQHARSAALHLDDVAVPGFVGAGGGPLVISADPPATLALTVANGAGTEQRHHYIRRPEAETEPNAPTPIDVVLPAVIEASLTPSDLDGYRFTLTEATSLRIETELSDGSCDADTRLRLVDDTGTVIAEDNDSGPGRCAQLRAGDTPLLQGLAAGRYTLWVDAGGNPAVGDYLLYLAPQ